MGMADNPPSSKPQVRIFGGAAAFTFEAGNHKGKPVLIVDAAAGSGTAFDWNNKITLTFPPHSVAPILAVLCRFRQDFHEKGHGARNDKSLAIKGQPDNHYLVISQGKLNCAAPIPAGNVYELIDLCTSILLMASTLPAPRPQDIWGQLRLSTPPAPSPGR